MRWILVLVFLSASAHASEVDEIRRLKSEVYMLRQEIEARQIPAPKRPTQATEFERCADWLCRTKGECNPYKALQASDCPHWKRHTK